MPYILQEKREKYQQLINDLVYELYNDVDNLEGNLNFIVSSIISEFTEGERLNYKNINALVGSLECCKLELYSRIAVPYEKLKRDENGDVYENVRSNEESDS